MVKALLSERHYLTCSLQADIKLRRNLYKTTQGGRSGFWVSLYSQNISSFWRGICFPEDGYKGDYIEDMAKEVISLYGNKYAEMSFQESETVFTDFSYKAMLKEIKKDLGDFGILFNTWQSERELYSSSDVEKAIDDLRYRGHLYEQDGALWFRSTDFGDDKDRVIKKKDGEFTYFASDIAYHRKKIEKGFDEIVDIWGADHHGYIPRVKAVIGALGYPPDHLKVLLVQMVTLLRGGKPVQMSKRAGEFVTLKEVMDESALTRQSSYFCKVTGQPS